MKFLETLAAKAGFVRAQKRALPVLARRQYAAAQISRLTEDWAGAFSSADSELAGSAQRVRARARQLERDNPFVERYFKLLENNVLGSTGIGLQMKVRDPDRIEGGKIKRGGYDTLANAAIEAGWYDWTRGKNCCVDGATSLQAIEKLALRSAARDGSMFILFHEGAGKYGLQLECFEADYLREDYNELLPSGNVVRYGVEMTPQRKPVAYHFFNRNPNDSGVAAVGLRTVRIVAERVIHVCRRNRQGQTNGISWLAPVMMRLKMLDGYEEAELIAARCAASKMGFYVKTMPADYQGAEDSAGNPTQEMQPGVIEDLPMGTSFQTLDPQHPVAAYADFVKAALRGVSSGIGVSYNSLASDLEGVNYSSIRAGLLEEREEWKGIQNWFIETVRTVIFEKWLSMALLSGELKLPNGSALPAAKFDKFNAPEWKPRRWQWVDPLKDLNAKVLAIEKGLDSRRSVISEQGGDVEDVMADIASDNDLAETYGLEFPTDTPPPPQQPAAQAAAAED